MLLHRLLTALGGPTMAFEKPVMSSASTLQRAIAASGSTAAGEAPYAAAHRLASRAESDAASGTPLVNGLPRSISATSHASSSAVGTGAAPGNAATRAERPGSYYAAVVESPAAAHSAAAAAAAALHHSQQQHGMRPPVYASYMGATQLHQALPSGLAITYPYMARGRGIVPRVWCRQRRRRQQ
jgi:hypothetical protein